VRICAPEHRLDSQLVLLLNQDAQVDSSRNIQIADLNALNAGVTRVRLSVDEADRLGAVEGLRVRLTATMGGASSQSYLTTMPK
jgi:hypothetical protein